MVPDHKPDDKEHDSSQKSSESVPVGLVVDEHGNPYTHASYPHEAFKKAAEVISDHVPRKDRLMIVLTAIIALSTVAQYRLAKSNNESTGRQVDRLLGAADRINDAADRFAASSAHISSGIQDAVGKLSEQSKASRDFATLTASQFTQERRPYLGQDPNQMEAPLVEEIPEMPGYYHVYWNYHFLNFGKTPAQNVTFFTQISMGGSSFESGYLYNGLPVASARTALAAIAQDSRGFKTIFSKPIKPEEAKRLLATPDAIQMRVIIQYESMLKTHYETAICMKYQTPVIAFCTPNYVY